MNLPSREYAGETKKEYSLSIRSRPVGFAHHIAAGGSATIPHWVSGRTDSYEDRISR